jgi:chemotaxis methyl-accepting protein methylase
MSGPLAQGRSSSGPTATLPVCRLIYKRAGISLHDGKHAMVYSRLSRRLRRPGIELCQLSGLAGEHQRRTRMAEIRQRSHHESDLVLP